VEISARGASNEGGTLEFHIENGNEVVVQSQQVSSRNKPPFAEYNAARTSSGYNPSQETLNQKDIISRDSMLYKPVEENKNAEIWRLRCRLMAEKYFAIIKDMRKSLSKLKEKSKD
jgi:hypothetical protein